MTERMWWSLLVRLAYLLAIVLSLLSAVHAQDDVEDETGEQPNPEPAKEDSSVQDAKIEVFAFNFPIYQDGAANRTLHVRGNGFTADMDIEFEPPLAVGKRVSMKLVTDVSGKPAFELRLIKGKTWLRQTPSVPYETIYVTKVIRKDRAIYTPKPKVAVARVYPRPEIPAQYESVAITHVQTKFEIRGANLSPKETRFVFDPELEALKDYDYEINEAGTVMTLRLRRKAQWRTSTGPLKVVAIRGGAGRIELPTPVTVATVTVPEGAENSEPEVEALVPPKSVGAIYRTYKGTNQISIQGTGFRADRPPTIVFSLDAARQGADFELTVVSKTELVLRLKKDKVWLSKAGVLTVAEFNGEALPSPIDLAEVFETPEVRKDRQQLVYESQMVTITINGQGFVREETVLGLSPDLKLDENYTISYRDTRTLELELPKGKKWPRGSLHVVWVQVGGARKIYQNKDQSDKGVRVALIEPDFGSVIKAKPCSQRIYQSKTPLITVDLVVLPPNFAVKEGEDVEVHVEFASAEAGATVIGKGKVKASLGVSDTSAAQLKMELVNPQTDRWLNTAGSLLLSAIWLPMGEEKKLLRYPLGSSTGSDNEKEVGRGVQIARVLPDIGVDVISPAPIVFASHTSAIPLKGRGFTFSMGSTFDVDGEEDSDEVAQSEAPFKRIQPVVFDPPLVQEDDFVVIYGSENELTFELLKDRRWRPSPGGLRLVSLDSGAGPVTVDAIIARVAEDDPTQLCSNDCPHQPANDGVCGDMKPNPITGELDCYGRDCADCGPRKISERPDPKAQKIKTDLCSDSCGAPFVSDGICEDGRPGAYLAQCPMCSDCSDCGVCKENKYANAPLCTDGVEGSPDELVSGLPCVFPFKYKGATYDGSTGCVKDGRVSGGWGWCPTTEDYERDGKWGSCQYCSDVRNDPATFDPDMGDSDELSAGVAGGDSYSRPGANKQQGFDFVRWLVNTLFFLVVFSAIGSLIFLAYRRRAGFKYQLVDTKVS